jgi:biofilm PGA synthesis N-glycosyltransferase PgaC
MNAPSYVLITPVRNEQEFIDRTIVAVADQTHRPERWVIVSDGSTDRTDDIVRRRAETLPFIRFVRRESAGKRDFNSKVLAIREGAECMKDVDYDFIGNLDGDVSIAPEYFEQLLARFNEQPVLGLAGGLIYEDLGDSWRAQTLGTDRSVAGAVQMFRRACWEAIGGYPPLRYGGEDAAAEIMARQRGWHTRTFRDLRVQHHRRVGMEGQSALRAFYNMGWREAVIGYHPMFEMVRVLNRMRSAPVILGGLSHLGGYLSAKAWREPIGLPVDCVEFLRHEQMERLRGLVSRKVRA